MKMSLSAIALALPASATLRLAGACGLRIEAREGRIWLTEEGYLDDIFLSPGEHYLVRSARRVVIEAEGDSVVALGPAAVAGRGLAPAGSSLTGAASPDQLRQCCPPSTGRQTPVMNFASSLARKTAAMAMSQGSPILPIGQASSRARIISSVLAY